MIDVVSPGDRRSYSLRDDGYLRLREPPNLTRYDLRQQSPTPKGKDWLF